MAVLFNDPPPGEMGSSETTDADHGRIEIRRHPVTQAVDWLFSSRRNAGELAMPGLATLARVEPRPSAKDGPHARCALIAPPPSSPERFTQAVREHWAIENSLQWVLDTTFDEDRARIRRDHGPQNLAIIGKLALNVLQTARPDISIRRKRKRSAGTADPKRQSLSLRIYVRALDGFRSMLRTPTPRAMSRCHETEPAMTEAAAKGPASYFPSIEKKYGRPISEWQQIVRDGYPARHMELVAILKGQHGMGHGHANALVAHTLSQDGLK